jgi:hypothetical protein
MAGKQTQRSEHPLIRVLLTEGGKNLHGCELN